jgi:hypothetical protein
VAVLHHHRGQAVTHRRVGVELKRVFVGGDALLGLAHDLVPVADVIEREGALLAGRGLLPGDVRGFERAAVLGGALRAERVGVGDPDREVAAAMRDGALQQRHRLGELALAHEAHRHGQRLARQQRLRAFAGLQMPASDVGFEPAGRRRHRRIVVGLAGGGSGEREDEKESRQEDTRERRHRRIPQVFGPAPQTPDPLLAYCDAGDTPGIERDIR